MPITRGTKLTDEWKAKIAAGMRRAYSDGRRWGPKKGRDVSQIEYFTSGKAGEQARRIAQVGGFASGRARALTDGLNALRQRINMSRFTAQKRGLAWELTEEQVKSLMAQDCWYCGVAPSQEQKRYPGQRFNGIDRVDNAVGYTVSNVVTCCTVCNLAKRTMSRDDFLALARRIAERHHGNDSGS